MTRNIDLFGTDQPCVYIRDFALRPLSFSVQNGALRHIHLDSHEAIRNIAFVVRDRDWGTLEPRITQETLAQTDTSLKITYHSRYESHGAFLDVEIVIHAHANGLKMSATGQTTGAFETNRAGFTVLHPITNVAGRPVNVGHSDGTVQCARFPQRIAPWQPFMDITSLTHHVGENLVTCHLGGDTFEMEDQRQWGDASFKTYNRPLAQPWPYNIPEGAALAQSVELTWTSAAPLPDDPPRTMPHDVRFPQLALVITPADARRLAGSPQDLDAVAPQRLLCHLDATLGKTAAQFDAFAAAQRACPATAFDLELICCCDADPWAEFLTLAAQMRHSGFNPDSVMVCPAVDRQSTPPGSHWPDCPPLDLVYSAAQAAFPDHICGGGMVSFFPELNRKRPPLDRLDFVSHGLCPIVHAADDLSVMETLETIPHITRSARAIIGDRAYRIGPATIAMRQNPYGNRTSPNPHNTRICMADTDPRHSAAFGAAYAMGLACALAPAQISVWTPAALYGPRGVISDGKPWPIANALCTLSQLADQRVLSAEIVRGMAQMVVGDTVIMANLTANQKDALGPYDWRASHSH